MYGEVAMKAEARQSVAPLDISSENLREYIYPDGRTFRVEEPRQLFITDSGSHRIVDRFGFVYRPERGYTGIRWLPKNGAPLFVA